MIHLDKFIFEEFIQEQLVDINAKIISESLNCKVLQDLARQLKDLKAERQKEIDDEYDKDVQRWGHAYRSTNYNKVFREIFGRDIQWDKITDSDITKYEAKFTEDGKPDLDKKAEKEIRKALQSKSDCIVLIRDKEDKEFLYVILTWGYMYRLNGKGSWRSHPGDRVTGESTRRGYKELPQYEKIDMCKGKTIYFINKTGKDTNKIHMDRSFSKSGMIMLDPDSLKRLAEKNQERYKEILRKNRANRLNNDDLLEEAKKIIKKSTDYAIMVAKDPVRHADMISLVSSLAAYIYDEREYHSPRSSRDKGYYSGVDGLLPVITKYTSLVKDLAKNGGYDFQQRELKVAQEKMKKSIEKAKEYIKEIESKMDE